MLIGIDMGGTNIDGVAIQDGKIVKKIKNQVDKDDIYKTVEKALSDLLEDVNSKEIERINLSTTVSTNAIVEGKTEDVDLILQEGPGIINDFSHLSDQVYKIGGYVDHRGIMVDDLDKDELEEIKVQLENSESKNLAVVSKFSSRNPVHEDQIKDYFSNSYDRITCGHNMSGVLNFPRRVNTAYLNGAVYQVFEEFGTNIKKALDEMNVSAPIYILKADGGTMSLDFAMEKPVETILSGPAASFMGISALTDLENDGVLLDIGGTTTDIFFTIDDASVFERLGIEIAGIKTLVRSIYSKSIGLGGDSHVKVQDGEIIIGPERMGFPIVFGGTYPSLTDGLAILGHVDVKKDKINEARKIFEPMAKEMNLSIDDFARELVDKAVNMIKEEIDLITDRLNSQPVTTVIEVLENKVIELEEIRIIGGPARSLSPYIEEKTGIKTIVPENHEIANAIGACLAKPTAQVNLIADTFRKILSIAEADVYEPISPSYTMDEAIERVESILSLQAKKLGERDADIEIIQADSYNMVDGYSFGKNIRISGQLRPGLIEDLKDDQDEE